MTDADRCIRLVPADRDHLKSVGRLDALIESLFSHIKADWPHLDQVTDPAVLRAELAVVCVEYDTVRLHAGISYVTPTTSTRAAAPRSAAPAASASSVLADSGSLTIACSAFNANRRRPADAG